MSTPAPKDVKIECPVTRNRMDECGNMREQNQFPLEDLRQAAVLNFISAGRRIAGLRSALLVCVKVRPGAAETQEFNHPGPTHTVLSVPDWGWMSIIRK